MSFRNSRAMCRCKPCDRCATCQSLCTHARNALTSLAAGILPAAGARGGERKKLARAAAQRHEPPCDRTYVRYKCDFATGLPTWVMERSPPRAPAPQMPPCAVSPKGTHLGIAAERAAVAPSCRLNGIYYGGHSGHQTYTERQARTVNPAEARCGPIAPAAAPLHCL